jgi:hypothetical protein
LKLVYFYGWHAHFKIQRFWFIFTSDLPFLNSKKNFNKRQHFLKIDLFSWTTYPFWNSKALVYFHGRFTLFKFQKEF